MENAAIFYGFSCSSEDEQICRFLGSIFNFRGDRLAYTLGFLMALERSEANETLLIVLNSVMDF